MTANRKFSPELLEIDVVAETEVICQGIRTLLKEQLRRRGLVVGLSGGIDSSVTAALAVRALGPNRVLGLEMPERDSAEESLDMSGLVARHLGLKTLREDLTPTLEALSFYERYAAAVRQVIPEYGMGWRSKIVSPDITQTDGYTLFSIVAQSPDGRVSRCRLPLRAYLEIVAATSFKQRTRKMLEYYHADRLHFAVAGTPNRLEYDQGFFVKQGDGAADIKPIAHLYKSQVYQLAEYLQIPEQVRQRAPTTDTFSLEQGQDEYYFSLPLRHMDLCLYAKNHAIPACDVAAVIGLDENRIQRIFQDIDTKRSTTRYQHLPPLLIADIPEIHRLKGGGHSATAWPSSNLPT